MNRRSVYRGVSVPPALAGKVKRHRLRRERLKRAAEAECNLRMQMVALVTRLEERNGATG